MSVRRYFSGAVCLLPVFFCSGPVAAAGTPCVDGGTIERAALGQMAARHYYMQCIVIADGKHPFLARLSAERRAAAGERLKDKAVQTLACSASPRDPGRTGLAKKEMIVLAVCKPAGVSEVWPLQ